MEVPERPSSAPERAPDRPPRRLRRTLLLVAAAAVLGVVAGTCTGYAVQAHRPPTPLPPLSQPVVERAGGEAEPLPAAQDRRVKTDGDLRKLLVDRPKGAKDGRLAPTGDGWMGLLEYADEFTSPKKAFSNNIAEQFRRAAVVRWETDGTHQVEVRLVQYRQEEELTAEDSAEGDIYWRNGRPAATAGRSRAPARAWRSRTPNRTVSRDTSRCTGPRRTPGAATS
ncbi:hypothetical protein [Streptomyces sp. SAT1]|uniref:hypothetical protein n=1 Tax=Streptomyces sp. SAT1 TaxID=1849967 RepID=UPI000A5B9605|nr:hypothetical protein [Streptomyces sp. SAT1]